MTQFPAEISASRPPAPRNRPLAGTIGAIVIFLMASCTDNTPRPTITINPETRAANGPPSVSARIVPNQFAVQEVILEFGRRPPTSDAVNIIYNSTQSSYGLSRTFTGATPPTTQPFTVSFVLRSSPNPFTVGEIIDYQFKVTHLDANNNALFFWSERKSFQIEAAGATPPPTPPPAPPPGPNCQSALSLVSKSTGGAAGGSAAVISRNGAFIAFVTRAALEPSDTNNSDDIYRLEVGSGAVSRVTGLVSASNGGGGTQPSISDDGRFVAFTSTSNFDQNDTNGVEDVYRRDMNSNNTTAFARVSGLASVTNDRGGNRPSISGDGRFVAFTSASNFDPNDTNGLEDVYRRDMNSNNAAAFARVSGLASVANDLGGNQPSISGNGQFVAFTSKSSFDPNDTNSAWRTSIAVT